MRVENKVDWREIWDGSCRGLVRWLSGMVETNVELVELAGVESWLNGGNGEEVLKCVGR